MRSTPQAGRPARPRRIAAFGLLLWALAPASMAAVEATLSAGRVAAGQTVELVIREQAPQPAGASSELAPDLLPLLLDFHLVSQAAGSAPGDGRRELRVTLLPRRSGELKIPALRVGEALTPELALSVAATTTTGSRLLPAGEVAPATVAAVPIGPLAVSATVSPAQVYVGEQVLLVVSVSAATPPDGLLHPPQPVAAALIDLGDTRRQEPATSATPARQVYERRYALFPRAAGGLTIPPIAYSELATTRQAASAALTVEVLPPPVPPVAGPWLPARALTITEAGPAAVRLAPAQGLERMLTLRAEGLLAEDLPALALTIPTAVQAVADPPRMWNERGPAGVVGHRLERVLISAMAAGEHRLSTAPVRWWNTGAAAFADTTLPDWVVTVAPFASASRRETPSWRPAGLALPPELSATAPTAAATPWWRGPWVFALLGLAAGALVAVWWRRRAA